MRFVTYETLAVENRQLIIAFAMAASKMEKQGGAPFRGRTGHPPAGSRSQSLARPKFPSRANTILAGMLARGVDILARDYVKPQPKAEAGGGSRPGQGPIMPALSDRDARAVTRLAQAFFHLIESPPGRGSWPTRRSLARSAHPKTSGTRPAPSGAWGGRQERKKPAGCSCGRG